jgi:trehalose 6-phosphate synthase
MRSSIFSSLLKADRVGFQTKKDAFNFIQTCRFYLEDTESKGARTSIISGDRTVEAQSYPISINVDKVNSLIKQERTQLQKSQLINFISDRRLILRVDRIEPSKNILRGLKAYRLFLEKYPRFQGKVQMLGLLVPSRMEVDEYQDYLEDVMAEAGMINALFSDSIWEPVRLIVGDNYHRAIAAMQLYSVLLVNPIADGMNLVAKEGALVNQHDGVLVLSEHAGAYDELGKDAISVSPYDIYGTAAAIHRALTMDIQERKARAEKMRQIVQNADIKRWFNNQLADAVGEG